MSFQRTNRRSRRAGKFFLLAAPLLLVILAAIPLVGMSVGQAPLEDETVPGSSPGLALVNADREFVERKKEGEFIARPVYDRQIDALYYAIRNADTGDWITPLYRVLGGEKKLSDGWEYSWEYPALAEHPTLDPERAYLLVMVAGMADGHTKAFHAVIPIHEPSRIWDRILSALSPGRWAKAFATWVVEGTHGTLCGVVERATGEGADNCRGG